MPKKGKVHILTLMYKEGKGSGGVTLIGNRFYFANTYISFNRFPRNEVTKFPFDSNDYAYLTYDEFDPENMTYPQIE